MHMRVVDEITGPGLQYTDQTYLTTDQAWISGQFLDRLSSAEFGGQREGQQEIRSGQQ